MSTYSRSRDAFDHVLDVVLARDHTSPLKQALLQHGYTDMPALLMLIDQDIDSLTYYASESGTDVPIPQFEKALVASFIDYYLYRYSINEPIDSNWNEITHEQFDDFMIDSDRQAHYSIVFPVSLHLSKTDDDVHYHSTSAPIPYTSTPPFMTTSPRPTITSSPLKPTNMVVVTPTCTQVMPMPTIIPTRKLLQAKASASVLTPATNPTTPSTFAPTLSPTDKLTNSPTPKLSEGVNDASPAVRHDLNFDFRNRANGHSIHDQFWNWKRINVITLVNTTYISAAISITPTYAGVHIFEKQATIIRFKQFRDHRHRVVVINARFLASTPEGTAKLGFLADSDVMDGVCTEHSARHYILVGSGVACFDTTAIYNWSSAVVIFKMTSQLVNTVEWKICEWGAHDKLTADCVKMDIRRKVIASFGHQQQQRSTLNVFRCIYVWLEIITSAWRRCEG